MIALDDNIEDHPKFVGLSDEAFGLWVRCIGYCRKNLTDGFVPERAATGRCRSRRPGDTIEELLRTAPACKNPLWVRVDGGYRVHDYLDWNPSREEVAAKVEANREKGRRGGQRAAEVRWGSKQPVSSRLTAGLASGLPPSKAAAHTLAVTQSNPDPIRSDPDLQISPETKSLHYPPETFVGADAAASDRRSKEPTKRRARTVKEDLEVEALTPTEVAARLAVYGDETLMPIVTHPNKLARDLVAIGPGLDVAAKIREAGAWLRANPTRAKSNGNKFLVGWVTRAQERHGGRGQQLDKVQRTPGYQAIEVQKRAALHAELDAKRPRKTEDEILKGDDIPF